MKIYLNILFLLLCLSNQAICQNQKTDPELFVVEPYPLEITFNKTVSLVFPYSIKSVDKGSRQVLAQKARGIENVLLVKAASKDFPQTNLTVITTDGKLHCFVVDYADDVSQVAIELVGNSQQEEASFSSPGFNEKKLKQTANDVLAMRSNVNNAKVKNNKVRMALTGVYVKDDVILLRLFLYNYSHISFDLETARFFLQDKKKAKRSAIQQQEIQALDAATDTTTVQGEASLALVYALPKFTVPDKKYLSIQLSEKDGGRNLSLRVKARTVSRANPLP